MEVVNCLLIVEAYPLKKLVIGEHCVSAVFWVLELFHGEFDLHRLTKYRIRFKPADLKCEELGMDRPNQAVEAYAE